MITMRPRKAGLNTLSSSGLSARTSASCVGAVSGSAVNVMIVSVPAFVVSRMIVLRKSISRPSPSDITPLSNTWKNSSSTSGCAFSTSSSRTTEYGRRRTASVSTPPSP
jgi:hypothetical protein